MRCSCIGEVGDFEVFAVKDFGELVTLGLVGPFAIASNVDLTASEVTIGLRAEEVTEGVDELERPRRGASREPRGEVGYRPVGREAGEGRLFCCAIKDVFSNGIVGYSIADRVTADLAAAALRMAVQRRRPAGTTVHSHRGSQFRSRRFVLELGPAGLTGSIGRVGAAGDHAAMESSFALLQKNVLDQRVWATRAELRLAIVHGIEAVYHRRRRQRVLGRLTPFEYENIMTSQAASAA